MHDCAFHSSLSFAPLLSRMVRQYLFTSHSLVSDSWTALCAVQFFYVYLFILCLVSHSLSFVSYCLWVCCPFKWVYSVLYVTCIAKCSICVQNFSSFTSNIENGSNIQFFQLCLSFYDFIIIKVAILKMYESVCVLVLWKQIDEKEDQMNHSSELYNDAFNKWYFVILLVFRWKKRF